MIIVPPIELAKISDQFKRLCGSQLMMSKMTFCNQLKQYGWADKKADKYFRYCYHVELLKLI